MAGQCSAAFWNGEGHQLLCYVVHPWVIGVAIYRLKWTFLCQTGLCEEKGLKQACIWCHPLSENTFGAGTWGIWLVVRRWSGSDCWLCTDVIFVIIFHNCSLIDRKFRHNTFFCLSFDWLNIQTRIHRRQHLNCWKFLAFQQYKS